MSYKSDTTLLLLLLSVLTTANTAPQPTPHPWTTKFYEQRVDHFSYGAESETFQQKILINNTFWKKGGPIFFYAGNEGTIELFAEATGFMFDIAPKFGAMLLFAEHRYYGTSLPFGNSSYTDKKYYQYQGSMQALADYAELLTSFRADTAGAARSPIIVFGGSYGGMLAAWMRVKYPHIVQGAIAASAPVAQFTGLTSCEAFGQLVSNVFRNASEECETIIRDSWKAIDAVVAAEGGHEWLTSTWKLCSPLRTEADVATFKYYLNNMWTNMAMVNYPYPANFLSPLPAHPVKVSCGKMSGSNTTTPKALLGELLKGVSVYFNTSGTAKCQDYTNGGEPADLSDDGWDLQTCTEMVMPMCFNNVDDMFEAQPWNLTQYAAGCLQRWKTLPQTYKMQTIYGGRDLGAASNIVFSNGGLDPWSTGGIHEDLSATVTTCFMPNGAHHLDLRSAHPGDPEDVLHCRNYHQTRISQWIQEFHAQAE